MSFEPLLVEVKATDQGFSAAIVKAQSQIKKFEKETNNSLLTIEGALARARTAVLTFGAAWAAFRVGKEIVSAGVQMQMMSNRMLAATGDINVAANAMQFARDTAKRLSLDLVATTNGFADFSASALRAGLTLDQTKTVFTGVSEAAAALHLSGERTQLVFTALSQMASKGRVSMEELSQQLGDSLPGALATFAKAMNVSTSEFIKMISEGRVLVPDLIKLGNELHKQYGERAVQAAQSAQGAFNQLGNTLFDLKVKLANSGLLDAVVKAVQSLTSALNDPQLIAGLAQLVAFLAKVMEIALKVASAIGAVVGAVDRAVDAVGDSVFGSLFGAKGTAALEAARGRKPIPEMRHGAGEVPAASGSYTLGKVSTPGVSAAAQKAADAREQLRQRVKEQNLGLITEEDPNKIGSAQAIASLNKRYEEEQELLEKALKKKAITEQEFKEDSLKVELDYQARMAEIRKQYRDELLSDQQAAMEGFLGVQLDYQDRSIGEQGKSFRDSINQAGQHNRTFFALSKAAAIAQALLSARQSVVDAYKFGNALGGPPLGAAFAGVAAAAQAANIAAIASTSFGGGGGVSSAGAGGGGSGGGDSSGSNTTGDVAQAPTKMVRVELHGDPDGFYSINTMRKIIEGLNDALAGGSRLNVVTVS